MDDVTNFQCEECLRDCTVTQDEINDREIWNIPYPEFKLCRPCVTKYAWKNVKCDGCSAKFKISLNWFVSTNIEYRIFLCNDCREKRRKAYVETKITPLIVDNPKMDIPVVNPKPTIVPTYSKPEPEPKLPTPVESPNISIEPIEPWEITNDQWDKIVDIIKNMKDRNDRYYNKSIADCLLLQWRCRINSILWLAVNYEPGIYPPWSKVPNKYGDHYSTVRSWFQRLSIDNITNILSVADSNKDWSVIISDLNKRREDYNTWEEFYRSNKDNNKDSNYSVTNQISLSGSTLNGGWSLPLSEFPSVKNSEIVLIGTKCSNPLFTTEGFIEFITDCEYDESNYKNVARKYKMTVQMVRKHYYQYISLPRNSIDVNLSNLYNNN